MAFVLRKVENKRRWDKDQDLDWMPTGDVPADCLLDLRTENNLLSVWELDDSQSNLNRVIAALAAQRQNLAKLEYAVVRKSKLSFDTGKIKKSAGDSPDVKANNEWHFDVTDLSGSNLVEFAKSIWTNGEVARLSKSEVKKLVAEAVRLEWIDHKDLGENVAKHIESR